MTLPRSESSPGFADRESSPLNEQAPRDDNEGSCSQYSRADNEAAHNATLPLPTHILRTFDPPATFSQAEFQRGAHYDFVTPRYTSSDPSSYRLTSTPLGRLDYRPSVVLEPHENSGGELRRRARNVPQSEDDLLDLNFMQEMLAKYRVKSQPPGVFPLSHERSRLRPVPNPANSATSPTPAM